MLFFMKNQLRKLFITIDMIYINYHVKWLIFIIFFSKNRSEACGLKK